MSWPSNLFVTAGVFATIFWIHPTVDRGRDIDVDLDEGTSFDRRLREASMLAVWIFLWLSLADAVERLWR